MSDNPAWTTLKRLEETIRQRAADAQSTSSWTAKLLSKGTGACAQKLGEEAVETVIAAMSGDKKAIVSESADLLYHWLVLLRSTGVDAEDVFAELARREGRSGIDEKASRE